jgi:2-oxoglutarate ferredoxin oxidoreductase subunit alpha
MPISLISGIFESKYSTKATLPVTFTTDLEKGFSWASENLTFARNFSNKSTGQRFTILDGNQALSQGAIAAGCRFFASYPITPSTSIGDSLSHLLPQHSGVAYQAEDEIAALGAVTGSSFSGVKAMTATSGPGFSLMQELISYLSMVELPAVIIDVMRAGPSTGMPTRHGQEDLMSAIFGGHGEDQRIVMAPASVEDCYHIAIDAFNCAENYACPVIVLSDYAFAFTKFTLLENTLNPTVGIINRKMTNTILPQETFKRYSNDNSTFAELPAPGLSNCTYRITGLEHDQNSFPSEIITEREFQLNRRFKKIDTVTKEYGHMFEWDLEERIPYNADACVAAWGFDVLSVKEAISRLRKKKYRIAAFYPKLLFPVCTEELKKLYQYSQTLIIPESNFSGQYAALIKMQTDIHPFSLTNTTGQPLIPEHLEIQIENIITKKIQHA